MTLKDLKPIADLKIQISMYSHTMMTKPQQSDTFAVQDGFELGLRTRGTDSKLMRGVSFVPAAPLPPPPPPRTWPNWKNRNLLWVRQKSNPAETKFSYVLETLRATERHIHQRVKLNSPCKIYLIHQNMCQFHSFLVLSKPVLLLGKCSTCSPVFSVLLHHSVRKKKSRSVSI